MAQMPKSITAEVILRFPSGKESKLGDVEIELNARYAFSFQKTSPHLAATVAVYHDEIKGEQ